MDGLCVVRPEILENPFVSNGVLSRTRRLKATADFNCRMPWNFHRISLLRPVQIISMSSATANTEEYRKTVVAFSQLTAEPVMPSIRTGWVYRKHMLPTSVGREPMDWIAIMRRESSIVIYNPCPGGPGCRVRGSTARFGHSERTLARA